MSWYDEHPELVTEIEAELRRKYPTLHLVISENRAQIFGTFPIYSSDGKIIDRYKVSIELPSNYPESMPVVRETGGQIPQDSNHHINPDGTACVLLPEDRWRCFPVGASFVRYLDEPLYNFFLSQTVYRSTGQWPFGEWSHGRTGIYEYYQWLFEVKDNLTVRQFLHILAKNNLKKHYDCPCGSGQVIKKCCIVKIRDLREKISPHVASSSLQKLGGHFTPYKRSKLK
ncbi:MAG: hypothetical protein WBA57_08915 [Elainellaceae cyanobacterium]